MYIVKQFNPFSFCFTVELSKHFDMFYSLDEAFLLTAQKIASINA
jgi:hypothetical protein